MAPAKAAATKAVPTGTTETVKVPARKRPAHEAEATIEIKQVRSGIGTKPKHRGTLRALGLGRIGKTNDLPDRPEIRGMIARVPHLITVSEERSE